jgi:2-polyprenyl-3-methyl-5-hydroxy-6-metoxy-1,4-benzoquinol methylase
MNDQKKSIIPIFNANYKGIPIKSDSRVHLAVVDVLRQQGVHSDSRLTCLDVATGKGSLAQRLIDLFPSLIIDCNDFEDGTLAVGVRNIFSKNLNEEFNFNCKYDVVLAIEVIEHLENPFHFIRNLKNHLNSSGFILLTTPNTDSLFDRLWNLYYGHPYYFGKSGILNSGGHITQTPEWLLRHIAQTENLDFEMVSDLVSIKGLIGLKGRLLLLLLYPLRFILKNINDRSGTVCIFRVKPE